MHVRHLQNALEWVRNRPKHAEQLILAELIRRKEHIGFTQRGSSIDSPSCSTETLLKLSILLAEAENRIKKGVTGESARLDSRINNTNKAVHDLSINVNTLLTAIEALTARLNARERTSSRRPPKRKIRK